MKNNPIEAGFRAPLSIEKEATANCFKIAYHICKKNQPLHNYQEDVALAKSLKSVVGSSLHSRWSGQRIADHIGTRMRKIAVSKLIEGNAKFGIMVDEASTVSKMSTMTVHLRYVFPTNDKEAIAVPFFLDLVQVDDTCAETLFSSLINCLHKWGFKDEFIQNNLISFSTDGDSNMTGKYSGLATRVLETFPNIIVWWCLNHRLQLSLDDAVKEIKQVSHFKFFMNGIYKQFSKSNLKTTKLASISNELETDITRIGRVFGPRWAAFSERSAAAVLQSYGPLYKFFSEDPDLKGFAVRLESKEFLKDLILMNDILHELGILSSALQSNQISIYDANQRIQLSINVFKKWKDDKSSYLDKVKTYEEKLSSLIKFKSLRKAKNIDREKLLQRGFSKMNLILSDLRNRLTIFHVSNLMAISIMGPPPKLFDPIPYVETWLKSHRHACSTQVRESKEEDPDEYHTQLWELFNESHHYYFDD